MKQFQGTESGFFVAVLKASADITSPLHQIVGGTLELVRSDVVPDAFICCNDNALALDLPFNLFATMLYSGGRFAVCGDCVLGCDFDEVPFFNPDIYAAPAVWLSRCLADIGFLSRAYLVE